MTDKPDKRNINRLIRLIDGAPNRRFRMSQFRETLRTPGGKSCGTAFCIAGWAKFLVPNEEDSRVAIRRLLFKSEGYAAEVAVHPLWAGSGIVLKQFDELKPAERKKAALAVLVHFRDTGRVDWKKFTPPEVWISENNDA